MKKLIVWTMALVFSLCVSLAFAAEEKKAEPAPATPVEKAEKKVEKAEKKVKKAKKKVRKAKKELKKEEKKEEAPATPAPAK